MDIRRILLAGLSMAVATIASSKVPTWSSPGEAKAAIDAEHGLVAEARERAGSGDPVGIEGLLLSGGGIAGGRPSPGLIGQRAVGVCAWLRNEGNFPAATRAAEKALAVLSRFKGKDGADTADALYWEAVLRGDVLGRRREAFDMLLEAELLAPDDDRIGEYLLELAGALGEFGE